MLIPNEFRNAALEFSIFFSLIEEDIFCITCSELVSEAIATEQIYDDKQAKKKVIIWRILMFNWYYFMVDNKNA